MFVNGIFEEVIIKEEIDNLNKILHILPLEQKEVIQLRYYENLSLKEISEIQQVGLSTVKSRLYQGIKKLRHLIESGGDDLEG